MFTLLRLPKRCADLYAPSCSHWGVQAWDG